MVAGVSRTATLADVQVVDKPAESGSGEIVVSKPAFFASGVFPNYLAHLVILRVDHQHNFVLFTKNRTWQYHKRSQLVCKGGDSEPETGKVSNLSNST